METEGKAKVVASVWGAELFNSLLFAVLSRSFFKNLLNSTVSSKYTEAKQLARQGIEQILPPNRRDDLCLAFCFHPSSMAGLHYCIYYISAIVKGTICTKLYNFLVCQIWVPKMVPLYSAIK